MTMNVTLKTRRHLTAVPDPNPLRLVEQPVPVAVPTVEGVVARAEALAPARARSEYGGYAYSRPVVGNAHTPIHNQVAQDLGFQLLLHPTMPQDLASHPVLDAPSATTQAVAAVWSTSGRIR